MRKFERITVERGVGYVRDTGITVGEIVRLITHGQQRQQILIDYPLLDAEDIFEAFAYAVYDLFYAVAVYKSDGINPLGTVIGYGQILSDEREPVSDEQRIQWSQAVVDFGRRAIGVWEGLIDWAYLIYEKSFKDLGPVSLSKLFAEILPYLPTYAKYDATIAHNLSPVIGNNALNSVFHVLLDDRRSIPMKPEGTIKVFSASNEKVTVQIFRKYFKGSSGSYPVDETYMFQNTSPLSMAAFVIRQHGSELQIHSSDEGVTFEFQLPIWKEPQP